ncbi:MMPL family transporter [Micromonospora sp. SL1-18]|uniref:MMPL family transporter n=1 Tax=Micromonospora sp. SL1-18 TaxID=3399128 RepID=UPI003A4D5D08
MFGWWGRIVVKLRWLILVAAVALVAVGVGWGTGVFNSLVTGGFDDPNSESVQVSERIAADLGRRDVDVVVLYSSDTATVDDAALRDPVTATLDQLRQLPEVASVVSYYGTQAPVFVSDDRHATYAAVTLDAPDDNSKQDAYEAVKDKLAAPGVRTQVGGVVAFRATADEMTKQDIVRGEVIAMPFVLILLVLIFRGVVAASLPLLIGILAILGALTATRVIATNTDVSTFAANTITLLGLGLAIDYSLFVVSRFREELAAGYDPPAAVARTMATAGRTVLVSGLTVGLALSSLLIFPQVFLRSMGMGGMAAVTVAMLASLTVLPAMLALVGRRIDALRIPLPRRRRATAPAEAAIQRGGWARLAHSVMRRPVLYLVAVLAVLGVFASPFLRAEFSGANEKVLPAGTEARVVSEEIEANFPGGSASPLETLLVGASPDQVQAFMGQIEGLPDVTGARLGDSRGDTTLVLVSYEGERAGKQAYAAVRAIRELPPPAGVEVMVGGRSAMDVDRLDSLGDRLPWMALIMAGATMILLFFAFGSVLLPIQAVLMNLVSIGASFGVLVWGFQDGHLAGLLDFTSTGFIEPTIPILVLVILFGLATDYEVFLISRVREEWDASGDSTASVAAGLQRTGRIITAAALLLIVVVIGSTTGQVVFAKMIGVGMLVAIAVDATLVRGLLVPATLRLMGRGTWWAPGPLGKVYRRYGIRESAEPVPARVPEPEVAALVD